VNGYPFNDVTVVYLPKPVSRVWQVVSPPPPPAAPAPELAAPEASDAPLDKSPEALALNGLTVAEIHPPPGPNSASNFLDRCDVCGFAHAFYYVS
jgi:hypothetical protein